ncbi:hypothetical protein H1R20_g13349, partial [Candolleomyces eurysporus]
MVGRHAYSLNSVSRNEVYSSWNNGEEQAPAPPVLSSEQTAAVDHAFQQLSHDNHQQLNCCYKAVKAARARNKDPNNSSSLSLSDDSINEPPAAPKPGPSCNKGKTPDPHNWGGVNWSSDSNFEEQVQAAALKQFNEDKRKLKKKKKTSSSYHCTSHTCNLTVVNQQDNQTVHDFSYCKQSVLPIPSILNAMFARHTPANTKVNPNHRAFSAPDPHPSAQILAHSRLAKALQAANCLNDNPKCKSKSDSQKRK